MLTMEKVVYSTFTKAVILIKSVGYVSCILDESAVMSENLVWVLLYFSVAPYGRYL